MNRGLLLTMTEPPLQIEEEFNACPAAPGGGCARLYRAYAA